MRAFVLGVDEYSLLDPLKRAVADATSVAQAVEACGYDVTLVENADQAAIMASFETYLESFEAGDAAFLYFAGHGIQIAGEGFLLPKNADCGAQTQFEETSIALTYLLDELRFKEPSQAIAVIDACRNPLDEVELPKRVPGMNCFSAPDGFCLLFSAGAGQYALDSLPEDDPSENGLFTRHFAPSITKDASIDDVFYVTSDAVTKAAAKVSHPQNPAFYNQSGRRLKLVPDGRAPIAAAIEKERCAVLLVANSGGVLAGPERDLAALERHLSDFDVTVRTVKEPDGRDLRFACEALTNEGFSKIIFYFSGQGGIALDDGMLLVRNGPGGRPIDVGFPGSSSMVLLRDLYRWLQPASWSRLEVNKPKIYMFIDTCVSDYGYAVETEYTESLIEGLRRGEVNDVSVLYSGSYGQTSLDTYQNGLGGMANGLLKALRPNRRLGEIASDTRRIVQRLDGEYYLDLLKDSPGILADIKAEAKSKKQFLDLVKYKVTYMSAPGTEDPQNLQCPQLFASWDMADSVPLPFA
ncbi:MAG: caspase family protein [Erythrobacter sp.]|nr:caspase family protein [Erythrobacter sp.]